MALQQLATVAEMLHLDAGVHEVLKYPKRELTVHFPVSMDDGSTKMVTGLPRASQLNAGACKRAAFGFTPIPI